MRDVPARSMAHSGEVASTGRPRLQPPTAVWSFVIEFATGRAQTGGAHPHPDEASFNALNRPHVLLRSPMKDVAGHRVLIG